MRRVCAGIAVAAFLALPPGVAAQSPEDIADRAEQDFAAGRIAESVAGFDKLAVLVPSVGPILWQRGIGLYILGRYDECAAQFLSYFKDNAKDFENAAWHFLCVARAQSVAKARASALDAGPDPRIMRGEIYEMFRGVRSPADVIDLANTSFPVAQFYAHLYVGLLMDVSGNRAGALEHIKAAASDRYRDEGGFMNIVAHVLADRMAAPPAR